MRSSISSSRIMRRPRAPTLRASASRATAQVGFVGEVKAHILKLEEALVLLENRVLRLGENFDERALVEFVENAHNRQATDKFGNQAVLDEVLRLGAGGVVRYRDATVKLRVGSFGIRGADAEAADPATSRSHRDTELLRKTEPQDLIKYGLIPEFVGRLPVMELLPRRA